MSGVGGGGRLGCDLTRGAVVLCAELTTDPAKRAAIVREAGLLLDAAERRTPEAADLVLVRQQADVVRRASSP